MINPILCSTPMVQAILEGRKTMTRRVIKPRYRNGESGFEVNTRISTGERSISIIDEEGRTTRDYKPPYSIGDILWVRESFSYCNIIGFHFKTDKDNPNCKTCYKPCPNWKSPRYMPKGAARIFLEVTEVRVERLQDITQKDAKAEGSYLDRCECLPRRNDKTPIEKLFQQTGCHIHGKEFRCLWDSINAKRGFPWEDNPWVWVIEFERIEK